MIIFLKKRILFLCSFFLISIAYYSINSNNLNTIYTSSTPISNHVIILDAGHGSPDGGAVASDGTIESELNLKIVLKLQSLLESSNCTVILTRSDENGIYEVNNKSIRNQKVSDMQNRALIGNQSNAEIFVSIHMNKLPQEQYDGWQTFYKNEDEDSIKLADSIQQNLNYFIDKTNNRKIKSIKNIFLTRKVEIPLVIVECGFLSNAKETELLKTDNYQELLSWSIYSGIMDYFSNCN